MSYALHKMTLWTAGIFLFEAVAIAVVALFYFFDFPKGFHEMVKPEYWIFITVGIFVIDFFVVWVTEVKLSHIRRQPPPQERFGCFFHYRQRRPRSL